MKRMLSLLTVAAVLAVVSCQKTEKLEPVVADEGARIADVQVVDGRLKFESKEDFDKTVQLLAKQQDKLDNFERRFDGFVSVRTAFSKMTDKDNEKIAMEGVGESYKGYVAIIGEGEDKEIVSTITDPILATLVSKDGWMYIGSDAFYLTRDKFKRVRNRSASQMANVMAGRMTNSDVINGTVSHQPKTLSGAKIADSQTCIREYFDGSNKRRMAGDIDYTFYDGASVVVSYESLTVFTKHQRRNFGTFWTQLAAPRLEMSGSVTSRFITGGSTTDNFAFGVDNTDQISRSYPANCTDVPGSGKICNVSYSNVRTGHKATATTGAQLECTVTLPF